MTKRTWKTAKIIALNWTIFVLILAVGLGYSLYRESNRLIVQNEQLRETQNVMYWVMDESCARQFKDMDQVMLIIKKQK